MTTVHLADWTAVNREIRRFLRQAEGTLPEDTFERVESYLDQSGSQVIGLMELIEFLYARRDEIGPEGLELVSLLAQFGIDWDFCGFRSTGRGQGIMRVMAGDETDAPVAEARHARPAPVEVASG